MSLRFSSLCFGALLSLGLFAAGSDALAGTLEFHGQNAALFSGANPSDTSAMMSSVTKPTTPSPFSNQTTAASLIVQALESQISSRIYNDIFGGSNTAGSYDLGGGNIISYSKAKNIVTITILDPVNGKTQIQVPIS